MSRTFPSSFLFGTATASYQVEGGVLEGGRGPSIWDTFSHTAGKTRDGATGDTACGSYHLFHEDLAILKDLNVGAYRFSIAWPRIFPQGTGKVNQPGLDHYSRMIDHLLEAGIDPWPTLYHWDLPQALEDQGGWRSRATVEAFACYAEAVVQQLGDRVGHWITLNEIPCFANLGYRLGLHAPGAKESPAVYNQVRHHALLAHGMGIRAVRRFGRKNARAGLAHNPSNAVPLIESGSDIDAAIVEMARANAWYYEPLFNGAYPEDRQDDEGPLPVIMDGDMTCISEPADFLGLNLYYADFVRSGPDGRPEKVPHGDAYPRTFMDWPIVPQVIYWQVRFLQERYGPIDTYITENGMALEDRPDSRGNIDDVLRVQFLREHFASAQRTIEEGLPLKGYFVWTLLDNFEWAYGYSPRFGLVHVDHASLRRTPKASAAWYRNLIATRTL